MTEAEYEQAAQARREHVRVTTSRARTGLTLLTGLVVLLVLLALGALVYQTVVIRENQARTKMLVEGQQQQQRDVKAILARNARTDATRAEVIDVAVARIAAAQRQALAEHDSRVEALLRRTLNLSQAEAEALVQSAAREALPMAPSRPTPTTIPRPTPSPCVTAGNSDRCRK